MKWTIGATNLAHPAEGTLQLEIQHAEADSLPFKTIVDLAEARHAAEETHQPTAGSSSE